jgi:hypothetical protein
MSESPLPVSSVLADRRMMEAFKREIAPMLRQKPELFKATVVEIGSGLTAGQARVIRTGAETDDVGRGFYAVIGDEPAVEDVLYAIGNFAGGYVFNPAGGGVAAAYSTILEDAVAKTQRPSLNLGVGFDVSDNAGAERTDVALDPSELLATPGAAGFMSPAYATTLEELAALEIPEVIEFPAGGAHTVNNDTTLQSDEDLFFAVPANTTWDVYIRAIFTGAVGADLLVLCTDVAASVCAWYLTGPIGTTQAVGADNSHEVRRSSLNDGSGSESETVSTFGTSIYSMVEIHAYIDQGATPDTFQLKWRQWTQTATNTTRRSNNSILRARRLA